MKYFSKTSIKIITVLAGALIAIGIINAGINYYGETKKTLLGEFKKGSPYGIILFNASGIRNKEYPLRHFISHKSIEEVKFLDPKMLKDNIGTIIVVLGDRPLDRVTPTVSMVYRVLKGVELSKKYPGSVLIMAGGPTAGDIPEAKMMALIAWSRGFDPRRIILEDRSQHTVGNAEFTIKIIKPKNIGRALIITDQLHLERAIRTFQYYFGGAKDVLGVDCNVPVKLSMEQMKNYLSFNNNRIVRSRLHHLEIMAKNLEEEGDRH